MWVVFDNNGGILSVSGSVIVSESDSIRYDNVNMLVIVIVVFNASVSDSCSESISVCVSVWIIKNIALKKSPVKINFKNRLILKTGIY